ncbi:MULTISPECIES: hypothetical protein [Bacillus cereus group]|uniref:hypothetical protein n=1 Tax=Bacillus cereus group TaxID=86661 RepID=UPI0018CD6BFB|nr:MULTISPECIES: hypothetical protein [Bacillus cereus group]MBG9839832.1 hypothetical protein [Bacillus tropicus]MBG9879371.1 hypothetical protein [Bacillus tropicus]MBG9922844.1 hypothetical protein [Bacillus tropicus]MBJ8356038.1 hypothetical protein [Bacillus mycoides]MED2903004.1 hypothetical protein [Bacillus tropicus]
MSKVKIKTIEIEGQDIQFIDGEVWEEPSREYVPNPRDYLVKRTDRTIHCDFRIEEKNELLYGSISKRQYFSAKILLETDEIMEGKFLCASVTKSGDEIYPNYYEYDSILIKS